MHGYKDDIDLQIQKKVLSVKQELQLSKRLHRKNLNSARRKYKRIFN